MRYNGGVELVLQTIVVQGMCYRLWWCRFQTMVVQMQVLQWWRRLRYKLWWCRVGVTVSGGIQQVLQTVLVENVRYRPWCCRCYRLWLCSVGVTVYGGVHAGVQCWWSVGVTDYHICIHTKTRETTTVSAQHSALLQNTKPSSSTTGTYCVARHAQ